MPSPTEITQYSSRRTLEETLRHTDAELATSLGAISVQGDAVHQAERAPLPAGYGYVDETDVSEAEVAELYRQVEIGQDIEDDYLSKRNAEMATDDLIAVDIGVRAKDGSLAGFSTLVHEGGVGVLCGFVVSPDHQHKGIGKALVSERLRIAGSLGVNSLYIPEIEPTNTLRKYYVEKGFRRIEDRMWVRGPHVLAWLLDHDI